MKKRMLSLLLTACMLLSLLPGVAAAAEITDATITTDTDLSSYTSPAGWVTLTVPNNSTVTLSGNVSLNKVHLVIGAGATVTLSGVKLLGKEYATSEFTENTPTVTGAATSTLILENDAAVKGSTGFQDADSSLKLAPAAAVSGVDTIIMSGCKITGGDLATQNTQGIAGSAILDAAEVYAESGDILCGSVRTNVPTPGTAPAVAVTGSLTYYTSGAIGQVSGTATRLYRLQATGATVSTAPAKDITAGEQTLKLYAAATQITATNGTTGGDWIVKNGSGTLVDTPVLSGDSPTFAMPAHDLSIEGIAAIGAVEVQGGIINNLESGTLDAVLGSGNYTTESESGVTVIKLTQNLAVDGGIAFNGVTAIFDLNGHAIKGKPGVSYAGGIKIGGSSRSDPATVLTLRATGGGSVTGKSSSGYAAVNLSAKNEADKLTIEGGTYTGVDCAALAAGSPDAVVSLEITGGTFLGAAEEDGLYFAYGGVDGVITGGTFNSASLKTEAEYGEKWAISGGTFVDELTCGKYSGNAVSGLLAPGYTFQIDGVDATTDQLAGHTLTGRVTVVSAPVAPTVDAKWGTDVQNLADSGTFDQALTAKPAYIQLQKSFTYAKQIQFTTDSTTLDLNGNVLTRSAITQVSGASTSLTVVDTSSGGLGKMTSAAGIPATLLLTAGGDFTLNSGSVEHTTGANVINAVLSGYDPGGTITIAGGTVRNEVGSVEKSGNAIYSGDGFVMTSGTVTSGVPLPSVAVFAGSASISGGTITNTGGASALLTTSGATANISGGTLTGSGASTNCYAIKNYGTLKLSNSPVLSGTEATLYTQDGACIVANIGGTAYAGTTAAVFYKAEDQSADDVLVSGLTDGDHAKLFTPNNIKAGLESKYDNQSLKLKTAPPTPTTDVSWTLTGGATGSGTLEEAFTAFSGSDTSGGGTITVNRDFTAPAPGGSNGFYLNNDNYTKETPITLNLNGKNVNLGSTGIRVRTGTLTVSGSGSLTTTGTALVVGYTGGTESKLILSGGNVTGDPAVEVQSGTTFEMSGGSLTCAGSVALSVRVNGNAVITGGSVTAAASTSGIISLSTNAALTLGTNDGTVSTTSPLLTASGDAYNSTNIIVGLDGSSVNYYDGKLVAGKDMKKPIYDGISGSVLTLPENYILHTRRDETYATTILETAGSNADLKALTLEEWNPGKVSVPLSPTFASGTAVYTAATALAGQRNLTFLLTADDDYIKKMEYKLGDGAFEQLGKFSNTDYYKVDPGYRDVKDGENVFTFRVTAENGATKDYTVTVTVTPDPNVAQVTTSEGVTTKYEHFPDALAAANAAPGSTLKLLKDAQHNDSAVTGSFTLDLNGKTLTSSVGVTGGALTVKSGATGGILKSTDNAILLTQSGSLTLVSGTVTGEGTSTPTIATDDGCSFTMTGGTVTNTGKSFAVDVAKGATVRISGGTVTGSTSAEAGYGVVNYGGRLYLSGTPAITGGAGSLALTDTTAPHIMAADNSVPYSGNALTIYIHPNAPPANGDVLVADVQDTNHAAKFTLQDAADGVSTRYDEENDRIVLVVPPAKPVLTVEKYTAADREIIALFANGRAVTAAEGDYINSRRYTKLYYTDDSTKTTIDLNALTKPGDVTFTGDTTKGYYLSAVWLYGGSNGQDVTGNTNIAVTGGMVGTVVGGGRGGDVSGTSAITVDSNAATTLNYYVGAANGGKIVGGASFTTARNAAYSIRGYVIDDGTSTPAKTDFTVKLGGSGQAGQSGTTNDGGVRVSGQSDAKGIDIKTVQIDPALNASQNAYIVFNVTPDFKDGDVVATGAVGADAGKYKAATLLDSEWNPTTIQNSTEIKGDTVVVNLGKAEPADNSEAQVTTSGGTVTKYDTFDKALAAAQTSAGSTLKLLKNVFTDGSSIYITGSFTLDLGSKTLLCHMIVKESGALTIDDSVTGGTLVGNGDSIGTESKYALSVWDSGSLNIKGGTVIGGAKQGEYSRTPAISSMGDNVSITISGGTVRSDDGIGISADGSLTVSSGTVSADDTAISAGGVLKISGGTISTTAGAAAISIRDSGVLSLSNAPAITGGTLANLTLMSADTCHIMASDGGTPYSGEKLTVFLSTANQKDGAVLVGGLTNADHAKKFEPKYINKGLTVQYNDANKNMVLVDSATPPVSYTVTFNSQDADTAANPTTKTAASGGTVGTLPTAPIKAGHTFGGWYTAVNGGGTEFTASTTVTGNLTVYAKWTPDDAPFAPINGGLTVNGSNIQANGNAITIIEGEDLTKTNIYYTNDPAKANIDLSGGSFSGNTTEGYSMTTAKIYGGRNNAVTDGDVAITMLGGKIQQLFAGGRAEDPGKADSHVTGKATLIVTGGEISAWLHAGGYESGDSTKVRGGVELTVGGSAEIGFLFVGGESGVTSFAISPALTGQIRLSISPSVASRAVVATGAVQSDLAHLTASGFNLYLDGTDVRVEKLYNVAGDVTESNGTTPVKGAKVKLMQGRTQIGETQATNNSGTYLFSDVPEGTYNVVATVGEGADAKTKTLLVTVDRSVYDANLTMPAENKNSVLEVTGDDTPAAVVGGLEQIAEGTALESGETSVTIKLTVESKAEAVAPNAADIKALAGSLTVGDFLDFSLNKIVTGTGAGIIPITETGEKLLEIVLPYDFSGKKDVAVYRYHGTAQMLTKSDVKADGNFKLDEANGLITIYAAKFSTYAVAYHLDEPTPPPVDTGSSVTTYAITATAGEGGSISPKGTLRVTRNASKTFTITPDEGYEIADVLVDGVSVGKVSTYTFEKVTAKHTIEASFRRTVKNPFTDVTEDDWFYDAVIDLYGKGLMTGTAADSFSPLMNTDRATIVTILWRMEGMPSSGESAAFPDVPAVAWYAKAVAWAAEKEIVKGYDTGKFGPTDPITREQLVTILWRYAGSPAVLDYEGAGRFTDTEAISPWAAKAVTWALSEGILTGRGDGILDPTGKAARAEAAAMVERFMKKS